MRELISSCLEILVDKFLVSFSLVSFDFVLMLQNSYKVTKIAVALECHKEKKIKFV